MFGLGKRSSGSTPASMSTRDRDRAQRRQAREDRAAAGRRAGHRRSIAKAAREAEQWEQQDRRRFGGRR